jgi:hypothetical protein
LKQRKESIQIENGISKILHSYPGFFQKEGRAFLFSSMACVPLKIQMLRLHHEDKVVQNLKRIQNTRNPKYRKVVPVEVSTIDGR